MTQEVGPVELDMAPTEQRSRREPWVVRRDVYVGGWIVAALALVGIPLGLVWQAVSPRSAGLVLQAGAIVPDETEAFIGTDGWFALLTAIAGLIAALARVDPKVVAGTGGSSRPGVGRRCRCPGHGPGGTSDRRRRTGRKGWRPDHAAGVVACDGPAVPRVCGCGADLWPPGRLYDAGRPWSDGIRRASATNRPTRSRRHRLGRQFASGQFATGLIQSARGSIGAVRVC